MIGSGVVFCDGSSVAHDQFHGNITYLYNSLSLSLLFYIYIHTYLSTKTVGTIGWLYQHEESHWGNSCCALELIARGRIPGKRRSTDR